MDTQSTPQTYEVVIRWTPADLQHLCPTLTDDQATELLEQFKRDIVDRSTERGWDVIEWLLLRSGYRIDPPYYEPVQPHPAAS